MGFAKVLDLQGVEEFSCSEDLAAWRRFPCQDFKFPEQDDKEIASAQTFVLDSDLRC